jgi:vancomycin resistance protein YoaR
MKKPNRSDLITVGLLAGALTLLAGSSWFCDPFAKNVAQFNQSISPLNSAQRTNIAIAASAIDGTVLRPGETFSFNTVVGPRTHRRGYSKAPSYLGEESPSSFGGGVCVLSSTLYRLALTSNLDIKERTAHTRTVTSVESGYDAAVWYPGTDLKFANSFNYPVRIHAAVAGNTLVASLQADRTKSKIQPAKLIRELEQNGNGVLVAILKDDGGVHARLISRDLYAIPQRHNNRTVN